ncbi:hypothetical protein Adt_21665 [Abeliophyllum distichum]|uniref:Uncharacterized protein n=1 Tax=Abeliophyllum distichum TaxID=126358 RepID=A0ABD1T027_9LAMI
MRTKYFQLIDSCKKHQKTKNQNQVSYGRPDPKTTGPRLHHGDHLRSPLSHPYRSSHHQIQPPTPKNSTQIAVDLGLASSIAVASSTERSTTGRSPVDSPMHK